MSDEFLYFGEPKERVMLALTRGSQKPERDFDILDRRLRLEQTYREIQEAHSLSATSVRWRLAKCERLIKGLDASLEYERMREAGRKALEEADPDPDPFDFDSLKAGDEIFYEGRRFGMPWIFRDTIGRVHKKQKRIKGGGAIFKSNGVLIADGGKRRASSREEYEEFMRRPDVALALTGDSLEDLAWRLPKRMRDNNSEYAISIVREMKKALDRYLALVDEIGDD